MFPIIQYLHTGYIHSSISQISFLRAFTIVSDTILGPYLATNNNKLFVAKVKFFYTPKGGLQFSWTFKKIPKSSNNPGVLFNLMCWASMHGCIRVFSCGVGSSILTPPDTQKKENISFSPFSKSPFLPPGQATSTFAILSSP